MAAKYWEIRESYGNKGQDPEIKEAYECGYDEGYEAAMKEMEQEMGERSGYGMRSGSMMGRRSHYGMRYGDINERSGQPNTFVEGEDRGSMGYRRGSRR